jgi:hypothetical protein
MMGSTHSLLAHLVNEWPLFVLLMENHFKKNYLKFIYFLLLFTYAYKAWVISPPCPHPHPYHPLRSLPLPPTPSIPSINYFALISNFVVERV